MEERTTPFEGATGVSHPILSEAAIRFVSQAMMEIFPASGPVKTQVLGKATDEKYEQANRVQDYMNYLFTEEMEDYRPSMEQLLLRRRSPGLVSGKVYYDPTHDRPESIFIPAEDFVVAYGDISFLLHPSHSCDA